MRLCFQLRGMPQELIMRGGCQDARDGGPIRGWDPCVQSNDEGPKWLVPFFRYPRCGSLTESGQSWRAISPIYSNSDGRLQKIRLDIGYKLPKKMSMDWDRCRAFCRLRITLKIDGNQELCSLILPCLPPITCSSYLPQHFLGCCLHAGCQRRYL